MTALAQSDILAEYAFLLGDAIDLSSLSETARRQLETRLLAAVFKRRWPLLMHWRRQSLARKGYCKAQGRMLIRPYPDQ